MVAITCFCPKQGFIVAMGSRQGRSFEKPKRKMPGGLPAAIAPMNTAKNTIKNLSKQVRQLENLASVDEATMEGQELTPEKIALLKAELERDICVDSEAASDGDEPSTSQYSSNSVITWLSKQFPNNSEAFDKVQRLVNSINIPPRLQGLIMLNGLVLLVASNWVVVKEQGAAFDPFLFAALRFGVASLAFSPFLAAAAGDKKIVKAGLELGVWAGIAYLAQAEGLLTTDASRASFLSTFTVLVVPFLAGMTGKGVTKTTWISAFAALVGTGLLEQSGSPPSIGDAWSVLSAVAFGVQMFRTEHWSREIGSESTLPLMSVVLATTAATAAAAAGIDHFPELVSAVGDPQAALNAVAAWDVPWGYILYTGLLTTDLALLLELVALRHVSSSEAAILYTLEPVLGASFAFYMLGEKFGPTGWVGASIIIASCLFSQVFGKQHEFEMEVAEAKKEK